MPINPFEFNHHLTPAQEDQIHIMRHAYGDLYNLIQEIAVQHNREKSLAITNLEQSAHWLMKSISHHEEARVD